MDIVIPGVGSLVAVPGDIHNFDEPPSDGLWAAVNQLKPSLKKESEEK